MPPPNSGPQQEPVERPPPQRRGSPPATPPALPQTTFQDSNGNRHPTPPRLPVETRRLLRSATKPKQWSPRHPRQRKPRSNPYRYGKSSSLWSPRLRSVITRIVTPGRPYLRSGFEVPELTDETGSEPYLSRMMPISMRDRQPM